MSYIFFYLKIPEQYNLFQNEKKIIFIIFNQNGTKYNRFMTDIRLKKDSFNPGEYFIQLLINIIMNFVL